MRMGMRRPHTYIADTSIKMHTNYGYVSKVALQNVGASSTTARGGTRSLARQQTRPGSHDSNKFHMPSSCVALCWHGTEEHPTHPINEPGGAKFGGCGLASADIPSVTSRHFSP